MSSNPESSWNPSSSEKPQEALRGVEGGGEDSSSPGDSQASQKDAQEILSDARRDDSRKSKLVPSTKIFVLVLSLLVLAIISLVAMRDTISSALTVHRIDNSTSFTIRGNSMEPTYHDGQVVRFFNPRSSEGIRSGDVAVFVPPSQWRSSTGRFFDNSPYIKRVFAASGDRVSVENGTVSVNGIKSSLSIPENYGCDVDTYRQSSYTVPSDSSFVVGDNVSHSQDSLYAMCHKLEPVSVPNDRIKRHGTLYIDEKLDDKK